MAENAEHAALFLKALTNPHRLMILCLLDGCERSVSELEQHLGLRQPTLSQQLAKLRAEGLVETRRDGKFVYYRLASHEAREVIGVLYRLFCAEPAPADPVKPRELATPA
ncbi:MAG: transcriptional regulator [Geminicoccaceae bacterium]|nr:MAG: transcriptional regulator [Geminicoccaceae bacterium]